MLTYSGRDTLSRVATDFITLSRGARVHVFQQVQSWFLHFSAILVFTETAITSSLLIRFT
ncbi:hypothetical protein HanRHA438_Chr03g0146011 [Helianthus annuus]|nr:hypothetical protein HanRHA438_Chr03g0146011 [Helianthus annuus]